MVAEAFYGHRPHFMRLYDFPVTAYLCRYRVADAVLEIGAGGFPEGFGGGEFFGPARKRTWVELLLFGFCGG